MKKQNPILSITFTVLLLFLLSPSPAAASDYPSILPFKERARVMDEWLKIRLDTIMPEVMRREKIDMWLVICREYNEDPVFLTLAPSRWYAARRTTMLMFYDRGKKGIERLIIRPYPEGDFYRAGWSVGQKDQWRSLADLVYERDPKRIGIGVSDTFAFGDGLSASLKEKLVKTLGKKYSARLRSAERLAVGWLEKRTPQELAVYHHIVAIAHAIIAEAFSSRVITPGVTTTADVQWWMRRKIAELGVTPWFHPWVDLQRPIKSNEKIDERRQYSRSGIIQRGDLLHCDLGITYLGLSTDTQEHAYVLKEGESDAPAGFKKALAEGNRLQDLFTAEFKAGLSGNQVLWNALDKARSAGLKAQIYTHPLGFHGHAAGPTIGLWDRQEGVPGNGDYPLYIDTCYAIELNAKVAVPEWNGQEVRIALEQDAVFKRTGVLYLDGRQTALHIIR
jgi:hypothetical protein